MSSQSPKSTDRLSIQVLAVVVLVCLIGIIVEDIAQVTNGSDALLTIGSLAAGALASRVSLTEPSDPTTNVVVKDQAKVEDDFSMIGRAATKSIIAEAMRHMSTPPSDRSDDPPTDG